MKKICRDSAESSNLSKSQRCLARGCLWGWIITLIVLAIVMLVLFFIFQQYSSNSSCFSFATSGPCAFLYSAIGLGAGGLLLIGLWLMLVFCGKLYWFCNTI
jgi:hypothetical protein